MYIQVRLLNGFSEPLWYEKPATWKQKSLLGTIVRVPLRNQEILALVINQQQRKPILPFAIRHAIAIEPMPEDTHYQTFINHLSIYNQNPSILFLRRMKQFLFQKETTTPHLPSFHAPEPAPHVTLTKDQQIIVDAINPSIITPEFKPLLIHGVTGSGKTEVYKALIKTAYNQKKTIVFLLPEVTLALEFEQRLNVELASTLPIFGFHSATPTPQKRLLWQNLIAKKPILIIGVHLPILLPIHNLGLIIIDEEHDIGYQEKKHPKINSKQAALLRAKITNIPIVLGSATPSLHSLFQVKQKKWHFFQLAKRFAGSFPIIKTVFLTHKDNRKQFWISNELHDEIQKRLTQKEQTIIFLNRRGHSFFVQCKACSYIFECPSCSVSLTLHTNKVMSCHYCEYVTQEPAACPSCKHTIFLRKGIGTQQAVVILQQLFPDAIIARADLDTTKKKKEWKKTVTAMKNGTIDILVGTQTITKGYHFPHVTLVGILWADLNLHFPLFNAAETTLQQLIQVAGRAGRQTDNSIVIVQTMNNHPIFQFLGETNYLTFYKEEITKRAALGYPPSKRLVEFELKSTNENTLEKEAREVALLLQTLQNRHQLTVQVLGPAKPPVHKIKNWYIRKIYIKALKLSDIIKLYNHVKNLPLASLLYFTQNPNR